MTIKKFIRYNLNQLPKLLVKNEAVHRQQLPYLNALFHFQCRPGQAILRLIELLEGKNAEQPPDLGSLANLNHFVCQFLGQHVFCELGN